jgi:hypothetical protein
MVQDICRKYTLSLTNLFWRTVVHILKKDTIDTSEKQHVPSNIVIRLRVISLHSKIYYEGFKIYRYWGSHYYPL